MTLQISESPIPGQYQSSGFFYEVFASRIGMVISEKKFDEITNYYEDALNEAQKSLQKCMDLFQERIGQFEDETANLHKFYKKKIDDISSENLQTKVLNVVLTIALLVTVLALLIILV